MKYQALIVIFPHAAVKNLFVSFTISRGGSFVPFFNKVEMPKVLQFVIALFAQRKTLVAILRLASLSDHEPALKETILAPLHSWSSHFPVCPNMKAFPAS